MHQHHDQPDVSLVWGQAAIGRLIGRAAPAGCSAAVRFLWLGSSEIGGPCRVKRSFALSNQRHKRGIPMSMSPISYAAITAGV
jgi:hypothetical protein